MESSNDRGHVTQRMIAGLVLSGTFAGLVIVLVACGGGGDGEASEGASASSASEGSSGSEAAPEEAPVESGGDTGAEALPTESAPQEGEPAAATGDDAAGAEGGEGVTEPAEGSEGQAEGAEAAHGNVRRGRAVFDRVCGTCHPGGDSDLGPRLIGKRLTGPKMRRQIRNGSGRMKAIPPTKLPERFMDDLMAYLETIRAVRGATPGG